MSVRTRQNRLGRGVRRGRDGEGALRRSRDPMHSILCTGVCPSWVDLAPEDAKTIAENVKEMV